jgi:hypothetical protein
LPVSPAATVTDFVYEHVQRRHRRLLTVAWWHYRPGRLKQSLSAGAGSLVLMKAS